jgi:hypothetical protein
MESEESSLEKPERGRRLRGPGAKRRKPLRREAQKGRGPWQSVTAESGRRMAAGRKALEWGETAGRLEPQSLRPESEQNLRARKKEEGGPRGKAEEQPTGGQTKG